MPEEVTAVAGDGDGILFTLSETLEAAVNAALTSGPEAAASLLGREGYRVRIASDDETCSVANVFIESAGARKLELLHIESLDDDGTVYVAGVDIVAERGRVIIIVYERGREKKCIIAAMMA